MPTYSHRNACLTLILIGLNLGASAQEVLRQVAKAIPTQISAVSAESIVP